MKVSATYNKGKKDQRDITVEFDFGGTADGAIEKFGDKAVYAQFVKGAKISLQEFMRGKAALGKTDEEIQKAVNDWCPSDVIGRAKKSETEKLLESYQKMSPEEQAAFIKFLKQQAGVD